MRRWSRWCNVRVRQGRGGGPSECAMGDDALRGVLRARILGCMGSGFWWVSAAMRRGTLGGRIVARVGQGEETFGLSVLV